MSHKVLLFGPARDALDGINSISVRIQDDQNVSISHIRDAIKAQHPRLTFVLINSVFALDNKLIPKSSESLTVLPLNDYELVLVPPVSGGYSLQSHLIP
jgi:molybdopterin converting factor small subunit